MGTIGILLTPKIEVLDLFDPVMALTYHNPYLKLPSDGGTVDVDSRARLLARFKVQIGGTSMAGRIALAKAGDIQPLTLGRLYE